MSEQQTAVDPWSLSPVEAEAHLAALKKAYDAKNAPPPDAVESKLSDPAFRDAYLAGASAQKTEIDALVAGKINPSGVVALVDAALTGELSSSGLLHANSRDGVSPANLISAVQAFRDVGVSDGALRELLTGQKTDRETYAAVEQLRADLLRDSEWKAKWLAGDEQCRLQAALFGIVRVNGKAAA
jgi:hypothetical protein